jgi:hypothetical protein
MNFGSKPGELQIGDKKPIKTAKPLMGRGLY